MNLVGPDGKISVSQSGRTGNICNRSKKVKKHSQIINKKYTRTFTFLKRGKFNELFISRFPIPERPI